MSHPNLWRCQCGTVLGTVHTVGHQRVLDVTEAARRLLINDRHAVAVCRVCERPVEFKAREMAGTSVS